MRDMREQEPRQLEGRTIRVFWFDDGQEVNLWFRPGATLPYSAEYFAPGIGSVESGEGDYYDMALSFQYDQQGKAVLWEYDGAPVFPDAVAEVLTGPLGLEIDDDVFDTEGGW